MTTAKLEIEAAIEVFVHGYSTGKSRTFPYEASRVGPLWLMRDADRKNPRDYRGEEWVVHDVAAEEADAIVRQHARPGFAVSVVIANGEPDGQTRTAYKALGYRLLRTEGFFVQPLRQIPSPPAVAKMLHDDRTRGSRCSVLTATLTGALLYPRMGYGRIGTLLIFGPKSRAPS